MIQVPNWICKIVYQITFESNCDFKNPLIDIIEMVGMSLLWKCYFKASWSSTGWPWM